MRRASNLRAPGDGNSGECSVETPVFTSSLRAWSFNSSAGADLFVRGGGRPSDRPWRPERHLALLPLILLSRTFAGTIGWMLLTMLDHGLAHAAVIWITPL